MLSCAHAALRAPRATLGARVLLNAFIGIWWKIFVPFRRRTRSATLPVGIITTVWCISRSCDIVVVTSGAGHRSFYIIIVLLPFIICVFTHAGVVPYVNATAHRRAHLLI